MKTLKGITASLKEETNSKLMEQMAPLEVCTITEEGRYEGEIVMRSASRTHFEVFSISDPSGGRCWGSECGLKVTPYEGDSITLQLG